VPGVQVTLLDASGAGIATTQTDARGYYAFTALIPGSYAVRFVPLPGYTISPQDTAGNDPTAYGTADSDADPVTGRTATTVLEEGENDPTWDLGLYLPVEPASIGNYVWYDADQDGIQDAGEEGVAGVRVILRTADGVQVATTATAPDGRYSFGNLVPGDYAVEFTLSALEYLISPQDVGSNDAADSDADPVTAALR
jgi:uncharacterized surface anchored protein